MNIRKNFLGINAKQSEQILTGTNTKIQVIDDCLDKEVFKILKDTLIGANFPWYYNKQITSDDKPSPIKKYEKIEQHQFTHFFYGLQGDEFIPSGSTWTNSITPILNVLYCRAWIRVKANLTNITSEHIASGWHYDMIGEAEKKPWSDSKTAFFCVNTNNGYTLLETGDKIDSVENRLSILPNDILHTGVSQTDTPVRVLLIFNFF